MVPMASSPEPIADHAQRAVALRIARRRKVLETVPWMVIARGTGAAYSPP